MNFPVLGASSLTMVTRGRLILIFMLLLLMADAEILGVADDQSRHITI